MGFMDEFVSLSYCCLLFVVFKFHISDSWRENHSPSQFDMVIKIWVKFPDGLNQALYPREGSKVGSRYVGYESRPDPGVDPGVCGVCVVCVVCVVCGTLVCAVYSDNSL